MMVLPASEFPGRCVSRFFRVLLNVLLKGEQQHHGVDDV